MEKTGFDTEKVVRILLLYQTVKTNPEITPAQLQDDLGITKSTLGRYRAALRRLGADIVFEKKLRRHVLKRDAFLMTPSLTLDERLAIILAVSQLGDSRTSFVSDHARSAAAKLLTVQDGSICSACAGLLKTSDAADDAGAGTIEDRLFRAIVSRGRLRLGYAKPRSEPEEFEMDPYQLFLHDGALYLDGYHWTRRAVRRLKVCRIRAAEPTGVVFSNMHGYDFGRHRQHVFGVVATGATPQTVRLRFSPAAAPYIREERRNGQRMTDGKDGSLEYAIDVEEPREVLWWALRWGGDFEVLEPECLREEAMEKVRKMAGVYGMRIENQQKSQ